MYGEGRERKMKIVDQMGLCNNAKPPGENGRFERHSFELGPHKKIQDLKFLSNGQRFGHHGHRGSAVSEIYI